MGYLKIFILILVLNYSSTCPSNLTCDVCLKEKCFFIKTKDNIFCTQKLLQSSKIRKIYKKSECEAIGPFNINKTSGNTTFPQLEITITSTPTTTTDKSSKILTTEKIQITEFNFLTLKPSTRLPVKQNFNINNSVGLENPKENEFDNTTSEIDSNTIRPHPSTTIATIISTTDKLNDSPSEKAGHDFLSTTSRVDEKSKNDNFSAFGNYKENQLGNQISEPGAETEKTKETQSNPSSTTLEPSIYVPINENFKNRDLLVFNKPKYPPLDFFANIPFLRKENGSLYYHNAKLPYTMNLANERFVYRIMRNHCHAVKLHNQYKRKEPRVHYSSPSNPMTYFPDLCMWILDADFYNSKIIAMNSSSIRLGWMVETQWLYIFIAVLFY